MPKTKLGIIPKGFDPDKLDAEADELLKQYRIESGLDEPEPPAKPADATAAAPAAAEPAPTTETGDAPVDTHAADKPAGDQPAEGQPAAVTNKEHPETQDDNPDDIIVQNAQERVKNAQARMHQATTEASSLAKRNADLERQLSDLQVTMGSLKEDIEHLQKAPAAPAVTQAIPEANDGELTKLGEDYPDLKPLFKRFGTLSSALTITQNENAALRSRLDKTEKVVNAVEEKRTLAQHFASIDDKHPDRSAVVASDDFKGWLSRQPVYVSRVFNAGTAEEVIGMLDAYKGSLRKTKPKVGVVTEPDLHQTRGPSPAKQYKFTRSQLNTMSQTDFEKNEEAIDAAYAAGEVDLSK